MSRLHTMRWLTAAAVLLLPAASGSALQPRPAQTGPGAAAEGSQGASGSEDSNARAWADAQRWFGKNDFAQAQSAASHVTSGSAKADAQAMLNRIKAYVAALQDGTNAEDRQDLPGAIQAYTVAARIKSDGPGNPAARIARVQQELAARSAATTDPAALRARQLAQRRAQAVRLAEKGKTAEDAGDLEAAASSYAAAVAADPGNALARAGIARLKAPVVSPAEGEAEVGAAIRAFYQGNFSGAERQLATLSTTAGTEWRGATFFYLGAARWYGRLQQKQATAATAFGDPETHAAFAQAKALGYAPLPAFLSPVLLRFWQELP